MRERFDWLGRLWRRAPEGARMLAVFEPPAVHGRHPVVRYALAAGTIGALFVATLVGLAAFAVLLFALTAIYFLATEVLGLDVALDPQALYRAAAHQYRN